MVWIKRNLLFSVSAAVGLILILGAGYFLYAGLNESSAASAELTVAQGELAALQGKSPYPTKENVDKIKESQEQVRTVLKQFNVTFAPIPAAPKMDEPEFRAFLDKAISQLQSRATNSGINIVSGYEFSFSGISSKLNFPTNDLQNWATQLQHIKALCGIVYQAKVNSLESIRRPPVPSETNLVSGGIGDFLSVPAFSNEPGVGVPYEIVFRAYSPEIADVLNGFLRSSNNFIIKNIDVAPTTTLASADGGETYTPTGAAYGVGRTAAAMRQPAPRAAQAPFRNTANPDSQKGPETIATENLSRVVMLVEVINPKAQ